MVAWSEISEEGGQGEDSRYALRTEILQFGGFMLFGCKIFLQFTGFYVA